MASSILIVDDEKDILELLKYNLEKEGYRVLTAHSGKEALRLVKQRPDLVVLDVMMPEPDGWEVCRSIRKNPATASVPVIFLTAKDGEIDEVVGLELGADDYIRKPVKIRTLLARIKRALRVPPSVGDEESSDIVRIGDLQIHINNYEVKIGSHEVHFPKKEFEVLVFLVKHPERVVSREILLNHVWGHDVFVVDRTVDVHIRKIREKLGKYAYLVETVKGVGYRFRKEP